MIKGSAGEEEPPCKSDQEGAGRGPQCLLEPTGKELF